MDPRPNTPAAIEFLKLLRPLGPWWLTAISTDKKSLETKTFRDENEAADWIVERNGKRNIYFLLNRAVRDIGGHQHAQLNEIESVEYFHVDIDPRAGEDIATEQQRALRLLQHPPAGIVPPTAIVFSGGGYQAFWKLSVPIAVNRDVAVTEDIKQYNLALERAFGADSCHNLNRIMRLPGTINVPDAKKAAKGRVPVAASLVSWDNTIQYSADSFQKATMVQIPETGGGFAQEVQVSGNVARLDGVADLDAWKVPERIKTIVVVGHNRDIEGPKEDDSRSSWLFDCLCGLARAGVPPEVCYSVITDRDFGIAESVLDKSDPDRYARRQIARAHEIVKDPNLGDLNDRHAVICNYGGRCVVAEEITEMIGSTPHTVLTVQSFNDFANRYCNTILQIGTNKKQEPIMQQLGKWWLHSPSRRQYNKVVFDPGNECPGDLNLWKGFAVVPRPGCCDKLLEHIRLNICSGSEEHYQYLLNWMAVCCQRPGQQGHVAVVLRGDKGTGKGTFANAFGSLFGSHYLPVSNSTHMVGRFNAHLRSCVVLFADEAFFAGDKSHESVLKTLITEPTMVVEGKHRDAEVSRNCVHLIMASNETWVVPAGSEERRFFVLDVGNRSIQDKQYFADISNELDAGGREALLHMLLTRPLDGFEVRTAPATLALQEQQMVSMSPLAEWWYSRLEEGRQIAQHETWHQLAVVDQLYGDYLEAVSALRGQRAANKTNFIKQVAGFMPGKVEKCVRTMSVPVLDIETNRSVLRDRRCIVWKMPTLDQCRAAWEKRFGKINWSAATSPDAVVQFDVDVEEPF
jgi:hypothetical protein